jgi:hypothetical protein
VVDSKISKRGLNTMRCSKVLPFNVEHVFLTMMDGRYRKIYDKDIDETNYRTKICTNIFTCYQKSLKKFVVSSRDFVIVTFLHKVSYFSLTLFSMMMEASLV